MSAKHLTTQRHTAKEIACENSLNPLHAVFAGYERKNFPNFPKISLDCNTPQAQLQLNCLAITAISRTSSLAPSLLVVQNCRFVTLSFLLSESTFTLTERHTKMAADGY